MPRTTVVEQEVFGKSKDFSFQILAYLDVASYNLSIARTIMAQSPMFLTEHKSLMQLKALQNELNDLKYTIQSLVNKM